LQQQQLKNLLQLLFFSIIDLTSSLIDLSTFHN
jgi:hypothetical protein